MVGPMVNQMANPVKMVAAVCIGGWVAASVSFAQYELGDGKALDANLQVGSGGVNPQSQPQDFSAGNNLITGNVPGLGAFHGNVRYRAVGELQTRLGSDDLFSFQARSLGQTPSQVSGTYSLGGQPTPVSVFRSHSTPVVPGLTGPTPALGIGTPGYTSTGLVVRSATPADGYAYYLDGSPSSSSSVGYDSQRVGFLAQPEGRLLEVNASPLLGLRTRPVDQPVVPGTGQPLPPGQTPTAPGQQRPAPPTTPTTTPTEPSTEPVLGDRHVPIHPARPETTPPPQQPGDAPAAPSTLGATPQPMPNLPPPAGIVNDAYQDLLAKIEQSRKQNVEKNARQPQSPLLAIPGVNTQSRPLPSGTAPRIEPAKPKTLQSPTERQMGWARRAWSEALQQQPSPNTGQPQGAGATTSAEALLEKLNFSVPRVASLTGNNDNQVDRLSRQAQDELAKGQYIDAQDRYAQVLWLRPNDPLARAGRLNAQIGAGMYLSAYLHLRDLFENYPEMILVRYQANLLPNDERMENARQQLMEQVETTKEVGPPLLLAYLGYQTETYSVTKYALDAAAARSPEDPLTQALRAAWLQETPNAR